MESQDKRPEVWVARRLMRRPYGCDAYPIAFFASKARIQTVTKRFLKKERGGVTEVKEYEVEYETPEQLKIDLCRDGYYDVYAETGDYVKVDRVFRNYITATNYIDILNQKLVARKVANAPASRADEIINTAHRDSRVARCLEKHFDNLVIIDNREF